eukprot:4202197-Alexandrium_andersonii.AAC.1
MSASLVGSEMCIRDSCWSQCIARACARSHVPQRRGHGTFLGSCRTPGSACLLYTSDAADDM